MTTTALSWPAELPAATADANPAVLPAHTASFDVYRRGRKAGEIHLSMTRGEDGIWLYDTRTEATAFLARTLGLSAEESAHFIWRDGQVMPLTYHQVARGPTRNRFWQHRFDWEAGRSVTRTHEGEFDIELEPGVVDPLTLRLAIAVRLHEESQRGRDQTFRVLERDALEDQQFFHHGAEALELDSGCFNTVRMERFRREGSSRNYLSWHAAELHWMPVRILQIKDGREELDIRLTAWQLEPGGADPGGLPKDLCGAD